MFLLLFLLPFLCTQIFSVVAEAGNESNKLFVFIHVSDIHLSISEQFGPERLTRFKKFCKTVVGEIIKPELVVVTGDLTHSQNDDGLSTQIPSELEQYQHAINLAPSSVEWIQMPGNHESRDVDNRDKQPLIKVKDIHGIRFLVLDETPGLGIRRNFNFFGLVSKKTSLELESFLVTGNENVVLLGHYPLSLVNDVSGMFSEVLKYYPPLLYLCGHLHDAFGNQLQTRHQSGTLELEVPDFKFRSAFRIFSFDESQSFSFADATLDDIEQNKAIVLFIHPKPALQLSFLQKQKALCNKTMEMQFIRFFVFNDASVSFSVLIDDEFIGRASSLTSMENNDSNNNNGNVVNKKNLFILPNSSSMSAKWSYGLHKLSVVGENGKVISEVIFSLDCISLTPGSLLARLLLAVSFRYVCRFCFWVGWLFCVFVILLGPHYFPGALKNFLWQSLGDFSIKNNFAHRFLVLWGLGYLTFPWWVGHCLEGRYCAVWLYGTYMFDDGTMTELLDTWWNGCWTITFTYCPLIIYLALIGTIHRKWKKLTADIKDKRQRHSRISWLNQYVLFPITFFFEYLPPLILIPGCFFKLRLHYINYGWLSIVFGPGVSWLPIGGIFLILRQKYLMYCLEPDPTLQIEKEK